MGCGRLGYAGQRNILAGLAYIPFRLDAWHDGVVGRRHKEDVAAELVLREPARCSVVCLEEAIRFGQAVERYRVELRVGGSWSVVARGTTIGHRKLDRFAPVTADAARIVIEAALDVPRLARLSLF